MLIAIEGSVGAGKSTVAKGLAACRNSALLLEDFEANPFLRAFYNDPLEHAIETEFAFLLLHFHQLKSQTAIASSAEVIADFHLGKDLIYADLNLKDVRAQRLFTQLYELCSERTPEPTLMICLSARSVCDEVREVARPRGTALDECAAGSDGEQAGAGRIHTDIAAGPAGGEAQSDSAGGVAWGSQGVNPARLPRCLHTLSENRGGAGSGGSPGTFPRGGFGGRGSVLEGKPTSLADPHMLASELRYDPTEWECLRNGMLKAVK